jgi:hypothetical protein
MIHIHAALTNVLLGTQHSVLGTSFAATIAAAPPSHRCCKKVLPNLPPPPPFFCPPPPPPSKQLKPRISYLITGIWKLATAYMNPLTLPSVFSVFSVVQLHLYCIFSAILPRSRCAMALLAGGRHERTCRGAQWHEPSFPVVSCVTSAALTELPACHFSGISATTATKKERPPPLPFCPRQPLTVIR